MASANQPPSRRMSRSSTPITPQSNGSEAFFLNQPKEQGQLVDSPWKEPRITSPRPSFQDHRGLERQGVLTNMMPLGVFPSNKFRARTKAGRLHKVAQTRNLEGVTEEDMSHTPDSANMSEDQGDDTATSPVISQAPTRAMEDAERGDGIFTSGPAPQLSALPSIPQVQPTPLTTNYTQRPFSFHNTGSSTAPRSSYTQNMNMHLQQPFDRAMLEANRRADLDLGKAISHLRSQLHQCPGFADQLTNIAKRSLTLDEDRRFRKTIHVIKKQFRAQYSMSSRVSAGTMGTIDPALSTKPFSASQQSPAQPRLDLPVSSTPKDFLYQPPARPTPPQPAQYQSTSASHPTSSRATPSIKLTFRDALSPSTGRLNRRSPNYRSNSPAAPASTAPVSSEMGFRRPNPDASKPRTRRQAQQEALVNDAQTHENSPSENARSARATTRESDLRRASSKPSGTRVVMQPEQDSDAPSNKSSDLSEVDDEVADRPPPSLKSYVTLLSYHRVPNR